MFTNFGGTHRRSLRDRREPEWRGKGFITMRFTRVVRDDYLVLNELFVFDHFDVFRNQFMHDTGFIQSGEHLDGVKV